MTHASANIIPATEKSNCRQTTLASVSPHPLSHTVPQALLLQISTRPSSLVAPSNSLTSPAVQPYRTRNDLIVINSSSITIYTCLTSHADILSMCAGVGSTGVSSAVHEDPLTPCTGHICQPYPSCPCSKVGLAKSLHTCSITLTKPVQ